MSVTRLLPLLFSLATLPLAAMPHYPVSTVPELLDAIGSHRVIELAPGDYHLSEFIEFLSPHVSFTEEHDGHELVIHDVDHMELRAQQPGTVRLLTTPQYGDVIVFKNCHHVKLTDLSLGHYPLEGRCIGGVLLIEDSHHMNLKDCDLFGSGTEGITGFQSHHLRVKSTVFRECSYALLSMVECHDARFSHCDFRDTEGEFTLVHFRYTSGVMFSHCLFENNKVAASPTKTTAFFELEDCEAIAASHSQFMGNTADRINQRGSTFSDRHNSYLGNTWEGAEE